MTNPTAPLLSESEVQSAESRYETAKTKYLAITEGTEWWKHMETPTGVIGQSLTDIPALIRDWRALRARVTACEGSRRVHELDNHHNALVCGYCAGPIKDESVRLTTENATLREQLAQAIRDRDEARKQRRDLSSDVLGGL